MNFIKRLMAFYKQNKEAQPVNTNKFEKQCPHCASRGLFVFKDTPKIKSKIGESNEKHK